MTRKELLSNPEYWIAQIQVQMYETVTPMWIDKMSIDKFHEKTGISKYKLRQIANGEYKGDVEEMTEILLKCKKVPKLVIEDLKDQK